MGCHTNIYLKSYKYRYTKSEYINDLRRYKSDYLSKIESSKGNIKELYDKIGYIFDQELGNYLDWEDYESYKTSLISCIEEIYTINYRIDRDTVLSHFDDNPTILKGNWVYKELNISGDNYGRIYGYPDRTIKSYKSFIRYFRKCKNRYDNRKSLPIKDYDGWTNESVSKIRINELKNIFKRNKGVIIEFG